MKKLITIAALTVSILGGCSTLTPNVELTDQAGDNASVLVYRQSSPQAALAKAMLGTDQAYIAELAQDEYIQLNVASGFHTFKTKANGSPASSINVSLSQGEKLCLEARPNHEELAVLLVPFVNALVPSFVLKTMPCPTEQQLSLLQPVSIAQ
ncbi:MAG: hypothetical protein ACWA44_00275 [Thiotrichales bacterium]